jgi:hypothetical protein
VLGGVVSAVLSFGRADERKRAVDAQEVADRRGVLGAEAVEASREVRFPASAFEVAERFGCG